MISARRLWALIRYGPELGLSDGAAMTLLKIAVFGRRGPVPLSLLHLGGSPEEIKEHLAVLTAKQYLRRRILPAGTVYDLRPLWRYLDAKAIAGRPVQRRTARHPILPPLDHERDRAYIERALQLMEECAALLPARRKELLSATRLAEIGLGNFLRGHK